MKFVSYAQNFEDVMLWRALRHVGPGRYVDVGAQHPVNDSVSRGFYEQGWRGIHVEPVREFADLLRADRPDETVLEVALSDAEGTLELNVIPHTGLSTAVDDHAARHQSERGFAHQRVQVPVLTLSSALRALAGQEVHWLKIDVEGFEQNVLKGWDSQQLRPWVMVVEATVPNSTEPDFAHWEPIVLAANYRFVYFDGLNRFYVAEEHADLAASFASPPNVFDNFELSGQASWPIYEGVAARARTELDHERARARTELDQERARHAAALDQERARHAAALHQAQRNVELAQRRIGALESAAAAARVDARQALRALEQSALEQSTQQAAQAHHWWSVADGLRRRLEAVHASRTWRTGSAIAALAHFPAHLLRWLWRQARRVLRAALRVLLRTVMGSSRLKQIGFKLIGAAPVLKARLKGMAVRDGVIEGAPAASPAVAAQPASQASQAAQVVLPLVLPEGMSSQAGRNYLQLAKAVQTRKY